MSHISLRDIKLRSDYCAIKWHEWHDLYCERREKYHDESLTSCPLEIRIKEKQARKDWCDCCDKYSELVSKYCKENPGPNMNLK